MWLEATTIEVCVQWETTWEAPRALMEFQDEPGKVISFGHGSLYLSRCQEDDKFIPGMQERKITGIVLWHVDSFSCPMMEYILLVEEKGEWAERVGYMSLDIVWSDVLKSKKRRLRLK